MKKIIICCVALLSLSIACKKSALDITPDGRSNIEAIFKDEKQTEAFLNTAYNNIPTYFYHYQFYAWLEGCTDNVADSDVGNEPSNISSQWNAGALSPSGNPLDQAGNGGARGNSHYNNFFNGIYLVNTFLANVDNANIVLEPTNKIRFKGEAQLLRAFFYLELIKQFGALPIIDKPLAPDFNYVGLKRPTFQQCVDFIVKDCDEAIANPYLGMRIKLEGERGRFSKSVAYAIKSEALLYNASPLWNPSNDQTKWKAASTASQQGLAALKAAGFELAPNYESYFYNSADLTGDNPIDKETIYEVKDGNSGTFTIINTLPSEKGRFKAGSCPSQELVDSYDMQATGLPAIKGYSDADHLQPIINTASGYDETKPYVGRDPRFYASVWYNGSVRTYANNSTYTNQIYKGGADQLLKAAPSRFNTHTGYYLRKFYNPQIPPGQPSAARWKKYRLAEIYLNLAEAENEANGPTQIAYDAINAVRARAGMPNLTLGLNKADFQTRVRNERRVEFFMEEHRFWDVRRWKILGTTDKLVTGNEVIKTGANFSYNRFVIENRSAFADKYLIFPIPIKDASIIPDFSINQNPGW
jgi:hypothetical protein